MSESDIEPELRYTATFVRGNFHGLRDLVWDIPGRCIVVSEETMLHLEQHAIDVVDTADGESLSKDRFSFGLYEGEHPVGYRFPTEEEAATADAVAASLARGRRHAAAKAAVDAEMAAFDSNYTPTPRARTRVR